MTYKLPMAPQIKVGGELKIESKFESVYDVPVGEIPVEVIRLEDGSSTVVMLDEHGKGSHTCVAGGRYQVRVQGGVSAQQVDALFASYAGLTADLEQWLREQWNGFKPSWQQSTASAIGSGVLAGSWAAIKEVWDSIKLVQAILADPMKFGEQLGAEAAKLAQLATDAPQVMERAMLLASDEAALYLMVRTAMLWLDALPPGEMTCGASVANCANLVASVPSCSTYFNGSSRIACTSLMLSHTSRIAAQLPASTPLPIALAVDCCQDGLKPFHCSRSHCSRSAVSPA